MKIYFCTDGSLAPPRLCSIPVNWWSRLPLQVFKTREGDARTNPARENTLGGLGRNQLMYDPGR